MMQESTNTGYIIDFKELKPGEYTFKRPISSQLFAPYEECEVLEGKGEVTIEMVRYESMLRFDIALEASVDVECDRCLEPVTINIAYDSQLLVKFSDDEALEGEDDGEVIWLPTNASEVDLSHYIYESIILALPYQRLHDSEAECNPEMLKYLLQGDMPQQEIDDLEYDDDAEEAIGDDLEEETEALPASEIAKLEALKKKMLDK